MKEFFQFWAFLFLACLMGLSGCTPVSVAPPQPQSFFLPHSFENYQSSGRILLVTPEQKYAGELEFSLSKHFELRLQIFTPVLGTLLYEMRANPKKLMILDFQTQQYAVFENIPSIRQRWLGMDISLEELSWAILGRMPQKRYQQFQGKLLSEKMLKFSSGKAEFLVVLGENGLMKQMTKIFNGIEEYQITIQTYITTANKIYPQKIQMVHSTNPERILLVMNDISPLADHLPPLVFLPEEGMVPYRFEE